MTTLLLLEMAIKVLQHRDKLYHENFTIRDSLQMAMQKYGPSAIEDCWLVQQEMNRIEQRLEKERRRVADANRKARRREKTKSPKVYVTPDSGKMRAAGKD